MKLIGRKRRKINDGISYPYIEKTPIEIDCPCCSIQTTIRINKDKLADYINCPNCGVKIDISEE